MFEGEKKAIVCLSDHGEEIDDEELAFVLETNIKSETTDVYHVSVNGKIESVERAAALKKLMPETANIQTIEEFANTFQSSQYENILIIQTGPMSIEEQVLVQKCCPTFDYAIVGDIGTTLNSQTCEQKRVAENCVANSVRYTVVSTNVIPKITLNECYAFFNDALTNAVLKTSFKNTFGRAPPIPFTAHLVGGGEDEWYGANFETVKSLYETITGKKITDIVCTDNIFAEEENEYWKKAGDLQNSEAALARRERAQPHQTVLGQRKGLSMINLALNELFHVDKMMFSNDIDINDLEDNEVFKSYKITMMNNRDVGMLQAYDLVGGLAAVQMFIGVSEWEITAEFTKSDTVQDIIEHTLSGL